MKIFAALAVLSLLAAASPAGAAPAAQVCFTPGQDCTGLIIRSVAGAQYDIKVQAYSFTSPAIAKALADAHRRGVDVRVILDKSQATARYSGATYLANAGVPVQIDYKVAIAHNKVIVIDGRTVLTGSFNFTKAAQQRNAENLLVIEDRDLASQYLANWESRSAVSRPYQRAR